MAFLRSTECLVALMIRMYPHFPGPLALLKFAKNMGTKDRAQVAISLLKGRCFASAHALIIGAIQSTLYRTRPSPKLRSNVGDNLWTEERQMSTVEN